MILVITINLYASSINSDLSDPVLDEVPATKIHLCSVTLDPDPNSACWHK